MQIHLTLPFKAKTDHALLLTRTAHDRRSEKFNKENHFGPLFIAIY